MRICFLESRSIQTPWQECHSSFKKGSPKSRSGIEDASLEGNEDSCDEVPWITCCRRGIPCVWGPCIGRQVARAEIGNDRQIAQRRSGAGGDSCRPGFLCVLGYRRCPVRKIAARR